MSKEKLKKVSLTKEVKAALVLSILAILLFGGSMIFANRNSEDVVGNNIQKHDDDSSYIDDTSTPITPTITEEKLLRPFNVNSKIDRYYFEASEPIAIQEQAILEYKGKYMPSTAMEFTHNNEKFSIVAAFSGIVIERKTDSLYGNMVYIKNDDGLVSIYGSLEDIKVNVGDSVKQGDLIGKASTNTIDPNLNNHLHFAITKNGKTINPNKYFNIELKNIK